VEAWDDKFQIGYLPATETTNEDGRASLSDVDIDCEVQAGFDFKDGQMEIGLEVAKHYGMVKHSRRARQ